MRHPRRLAAGGRSGFSLIEVCVTIVVMTVGAGMLAQTIVQLGKVNDTNRETALAMQAVRNTLETLRSEPLDQVWARYNADPDDDPGGVGSAPGDEFTAEGLASPNGAGTSLGTIEFPTINGELREDVVDVDLGMPRDLDGDGVIDALDHSGDYAILPVRVRLTWTGRTGDRAVTVHTSLGEL